MHLEPAALFAIIGLLGVGSQWLAWRLQMPAIVLMLVAGIAAGPATGLIAPATAFGDLFRPIVSVAVAVILFEGGLTLNLRELRETRPAVRALVYVGAPLGWILSTLAVRYGAGLSWESAFVFGGILVVTGPTVVTPLLRQAKMKPRPASILKWEAIVNDPVGALAAVLAFEVITAIYGATTLAEAVKHLIIGISVAAIVGYASGRIVAWAFKRGQVPEYMKVPVLLAAVLMVYASTDALLHESGLLAVTIMGVVLANSHLPSFDELRRFKEHMTILLVSGVFILLAASIDWAMLQNLNWRAALFVVLIVLVVRPLTVGLALTGSGLETREKAIVAWIAPRGIVAVAVSGLFGTRLAELGIEDGAALPALAFVLVAATVVLSGFSIIPVSRALGLVSTEPPGVLIVGGSRWSVALAETLMKAEIPVLISDRNWFRLREARQAGLPVYHGEILSEAAEHSLDMNRFGMLLTASDNDAYNALVCTDFAPEFGRDKVFQVGRASDGENERDLPVTLGGRPVGQGRSFGDIAGEFANNANFRLTKLTETYDLEAFRGDRPEAEIWGVLTNGALTLVSDGKGLTGKTGTSLLWFGLKSGDSDDQVKEAPDT